MATLHILDRRGDLVAIGGGLEDFEQPQRLLYGFPHVITWLNETLPTLQPFYAETDLSPIEQVDVLFHDFVSGEDLVYYERCHFMEPLINGVWELKTPDIRIFGWFCKRGVFIAA